MGPDRGPVTGHTRRSCPADRVPVCRWLTGLPSRSLVERQIADSGCADIRHHSQSLRSPANVICAEKFIRRPCSRKLHAPV
jgi:hypothetical protein